MKQYTQGLQKRINYEIQKIELEEGDVFDKLVRISTLLESSFDELKTFICKNSFCDEMEEICFFKEIKPQIFSKLIYYSSIYKFEMNRPTGCEALQKEYTLHQFERLNEFFINNIDFYKYYRARRTDQDTHYFLRGKPDIELYFDNFYFERDPNFSTGFDFKVARIIANDMLSIFLNEELSKLDHTVNKEVERTSFPKTKETWTDSKVALVELIYAIHSTGSINFGKYDLKSLTSYFENVFNIELGDIYRTFLEIRGRKGSRVQYLDQLRKNLIERMDKADSL
ncbi:MAG: RteC domain-containing protein [Paludibacter sp.]|nr:RteC domain-containing protein [Paludibacter sp.]